jgi:hypothetical protein
VGILLMLTAPLMAGGLIALLQRLGYALLAALFGPARFPTPGWPILILRAMLLVVILGTGIALVLNLQSGGQGGPGTGGGAR